MKLRVIFSLSALAVLAACSSSDKKLKPLPNIASSSASAWQVNIGRNASAGFSPQVVGERVAVATPEGNIAVVNANTGAFIAQFKASTPLSAGVGYDGNLIAVGNAKGVVMGYDNSGKNLWSSTINAEVISPPAVADGMVVVNASDGRVLGLDAKTGERKWVIQRNLPSLTVRNAAGFTVSRRGAFLGMPGGKLIALDVVTGTIGWESTVASPKGSTELERIADVVSVPIVDEKQACAVAYQGKLVCFDALRGNSVWSRDISSQYGLASDAQNLFVTDDKNVVHALDKSTGASVWRMNDLSGRRVGLTQIIGNKVWVQDPEGHFYALDKATGKLQSRAFGEGFQAVSLPVSTGKHLIMLTKSGNLVAFN